MRYLLALSLGLFSAFSTPASASPVISIPVDAARPVEILSMRFDVNPGRDLPKKAFFKAEVERGETLELRALSISDNLIATMKDRTRGTDALQIGEIAQGIDTIDRAQFLGLMLELARERRHAETQEEWNDVVDRFFGSRRAAQLRPALGDEAFNEYASGSPRVRRADFNAYLYPTDYLEVSGASLKGAKPEARYFVPVEQVLNGAGEIDLKSAKLKIVQAVTLQMIEEISSLTDVPQDDPTRLRLASMGSILEQVCGANCDLVGASPIGMLLTNLHWILFAGKGEEMTEDEERALGLRKQISIYKKMHALCPRIPGLADANALGLEKGADCDAAGTALRSVSSE